MSSMVSSTIAANLSRVGSVRCAVAVSQKLGAVRNFSASGLGPAGTTPPSATVGASNRHFALGAGAVRPAESSSPSASKLVTSEDPTHHVPLETDDLLDENSPLWDFHGTEPLERYYAKYVGLSGGAIVYKKLVEHRVRLVAGFSGGANLPILAQFTSGGANQYVPLARDVSSGATARFISSKDRIPFITNAHEQSSGHTAQGYAKRSGEVGCLITTSGPGVTNIITPLQDALSDGVPLIALCGQVPTTAPPDAFQGCDAIGLTKACTKWNFQVTDVIEIPYVLDYAFHVATSGRPGPVFIDLPKDTQITELTWELIEKRVRDPNNTERFGPLLKNQVWIGGKNYPIMERVEQPSTLSIDETYHRWGKRTRDYRPNFGDYGSQEPPTNKVYKMSPILSVKEEGASPGSPTPEKWAERGMAVLAEEDICAQSGPATESGSEPLLHEMIRLITVAEKPILYVGQGANDCPGQLQRFAERFQIPVTTTLHAMGCFDERHPLALKMVGMHGHATPNFLIQEADLVICLGARFDDRTVGRLNAYAPAARRAGRKGKGGFIHIDVRSDQNALIVRPNYFVHSSAEAFLTQVNLAVARSDVLGGVGGITERPLVQNNNTAVTAKLPEGWTPLIEGKEALAQKRSAWLARKADLQAKHPVLIPVFPKDPDTGKTPISAQSVVKMLDTTLEKLRLHGGVGGGEWSVSTGVGIHQMVAAQLLTWSRPRQMVSSGSLGTMGVGLGFALGASLADRNQTKAILIDGDGSFNMTSTELKTLVELNTPVKIMVLDNKSAMMVEYWQKLFFDKQYISVTHERNPDYQALASAFGMHSMYCDAEEELEAKMLEFIEYEGGPVLFHLGIAKTPCLPMVAPGKALHEMILEDHDFEVDKTAVPS